MKEPFVRAKSREGRCFELSYKVVTTYPDWTLVHGIVRMEPGSDRRLMIHAWAEKGDQVHDPVLNASFGRDRFYEIYVLDESAIARYSSHDAQINAARNLHYGSWEPHLIKWEEGEFSLEDYSLDSTRCT